jgi:aspartyl-tRNA(Asn)/glutamyl-tRNA(Gln) amidotransferase subunit A
VISLAGVVPLATTLDSLGPLARNVDDAALLTAVMGGPDPRDPATRAAPAIDFAGAMAAEPDIGGMRITALAVDQFHWPATPDVLAAREGGRDSARLGASIEENACLPVSRTSLLRSGRIIAAEAWALHRGYIEDETLPRSGVRSRLLAAKAISAAVHRRARVRAHQPHSPTMRGRDAADPTLPIVAMH